ncbi:MAG: gfo/Idh/MocA family oxidoreductase [Desulfobulbus sp.]|nr:MAG: gfo/Idh/MocA family oxidoreductase [Desulfobulbus sp.]
MGELAVGVIGSGRHGSRYANHIVRDVAGLKLAAISRRSSEGAEQAAAWRCVWHRDWRTLVRDPLVDAVIAVVPPALNLEIAGCCAAEGKPLLLEKPLAASGAAAAAIVELYAARGLPLTTGQTLRYNPVIRKLREQLPSVGRLYSFSANQRLEPSTLDWHAEPELAGAGVSFHTAVHVFDALRWMTGLEVRRLVAVSRGHHNPALEDLLTVLVEMGDEIVGTIDCSKVGPARSGRFEFVGSDGQLQGDQVHGTLETVRGMTVSRLRFGGPCNTIIPLLRDWQAFLTGRGSNPVSGEDGLAAVRLCEACLESARCGVWVTVRQG